MDSIIFTEILEPRKYAKYLFNCEAGKPHFTTEAFRFVNLKLNNFDISFASSSRNI